MVVGRLILSAARGMAIDKALDSVIDAYRRHKLGKEKNLSSIDGYRISDNNYFKGGELREVAKRYGLEEKVSEYKQSLFSRVGGYLAELKDLTSYLKNACQPGNLDRTSQLEIYTRIKRSLELMYGILGKKQDTAPKKYGYLSDIITDYMGKIGDINKELDRFLAVASGFHPDGSGLFGSSAKRLAKFTMERVLESRGIPAHALERIVSSPTQPFAGLRKEAKPLFAEYEDVAGQLKAYASDLASMSEVYGAAA